MICNTKIEKCNVLYEVSVRNTSLESPNSTDAAVAMVDGLVFSFLNFSRSVKPTKTGSHPARGWDNGRIITCGFLIVVPSNLPVISQFKQCLACIHNCHNSISSFSCCHICFCTPKVCERTYRTYFCFDFVFSFFLYIPVM
jgi:hypothetical protein